MYVYTYNLKIARTYTLDEEVIKNLKEEENASALIEELLIKHFNEGKSEEEILKEVHNKIKEKEEAEKKKQYIEEMIIKRTAEMEELKKQREKDNIPISFVMPIKKEVVKDVLEKKPTQENREFEINNG